MKTKRASRGPRISRRSRRRHRQTFRASRTLQARRSQRKNRKSRQRTRDSQRIHRGGMKKPDGPAQSQRDGPAQYRPPPERPIGTAAPRDPRDPHEGVTPSSRRRGSRRSAEGDILMRENTRNMCHVCNPGLLNAFIDEQGGCQGLYSKLLGFMADIHTYLRGSPSAEEPKKFIEHWNKMEESIMNSIGDPFEYIARTGLHIDPTCPNPDKLLYFLYQMGSYPKYLQERDTYTFGLFNTQNLVIKKSRISYRSWRNTMVFIHTGTDANTHDLIFLGGDDTITKSFSKKPQERGLSVEQWDTRIKVKYDDETRIVGHNFIDDFKLARVGPRGSGSPWLNCTIYNKEEWTLKLDADHLFFRKASVDDFKLPLEAIHDWEYNLDTTGVTINLQVDVGQTFQQNGAQHIPLSALPETTIEDPPTHSTHLFFPCHPTPLSVPSGEWRVIHYPHDPILVTLASDHRIVPEDIHRGMIEPLLYTPLVGTTITPQEGNKIQIDLREVSFKHYLVMKSENSKLRKPQSIPDTLTINADADVLAILLKSSRLRNKGKAGSIPPDYWYMRNKLSRMGDVGRPGSGILGEIQRRGMVMGEFSKETHTPLFLKFFRNSLLSKYSDAVNWVTYLNGTPAERNATNQKLQRYLPADEVEESRLGECNYMGPGTMTEPRSLRFYADHMSYRGVAPVGTDRTAYLKKKLAGKTREEISMDPKLICYLVERVTHWIFSICSHFEQSYDFGFMRYFNIKLNANWILNHLYWMEEEEGPTGYPNITKFLNLMNRLEELHNQPKYGNVGPDGTYSYSAEISKEIHQKVLEKREGEAVTPYRFTSEEHQFEIKFEDDQILQVNSDTQATRNVILLPVPEDILIQRLLYMYHEPKNYHDSTSSFDGAANGHDLGYEHTTNHSRHTVLQTDDGAIHMEGGKPTGEALVLRGVIGLKTVSDVHGIPVLSDTTRGFASLERFNIHMGGIPSVLSSISIKIPKESIWKLRYLQKILELNKNSIDKETTDFLYGTKDGIVPRLQNHVIERTGTTPEDILKGTSTHLGGRIHMEREHTLRGTFTVHLVNPSAFPAGCNVELNRPTDKEVYAPKTDKDGIEIGPGNYGLLRHGCTLEEGNIKSALLGYREMKYVQELITSPVKTEITWDEFTEDVTPPRWTEFIQNIAPSLNEIYGGMGATEIAAIPYKSYSPEKLYPEPEPEPEPETAALA